MEKTCELMVCHEGGRYVGRGKRLPIGDWDSNPSGASHHLPLKGEGLVRTAEIVVREELPRDVEAFCEMNYQRRKLEKAQQQERMERRREAQRAAKQRAWCFGTLAAVFAGLAIATSFAAPWWAVISPVVLAVGCIKIGGFM